MHSHINDETVHRMYNREDHRIDNNIWARIDKVMYIVMYHTIYIGMYVNVYNRAEMRLRQVAIKRYHRIGNSIHCQDTCMTGVSHVNTYQLANYKLLAKTEGLPRFKLKLQKETGCFIDYKLIILV